MPHVRPKENVAVPDAVPIPKIDTCSACGKLFPRSAMRLCSACTLVEENRFQLVREFLDANQGAAVTEISRATFVSAHDVRRFMESGRLVDVTGNATQCTCQGRGERCRFCRSQLAGTFQAMEQKMARERGSERESGSESGRTSYVRRMNRLGDTG
ncbi:MAG: flagellar protein [Thermoleophilia bacterium]|nr:flagellar protein [Thermoleophilia bacterium]